MMTVIPLLRLPQHHGREPWREEVGKRAQLVLPASLGPEAGPVRSPHLQMNKEKPARAGSVAREEER